MLRMGQLLSTDLYLQYADGAAPEELAAHYGMSVHTVSERIEAARLCFEYQIIMPEFPLELLLTEDQWQVAASGCKVSGA